jgi:hypothetical protein
MDRAESVAAATESIDSATESIDSVSESIDSASESIDSASESIDSASESIDSVTESIDSAAKTIDSAAFKTAGAAFQEAPGTSEIGLGRGRDAVFSLVSDVLSVAVTDFQGLAPIRVCLSYRPFCFSPRIPPNRFHCPLPGLPAPLPEDSAPLPKDSAPLPEDPAPLPEVPAPLPEDLAPLPEDSAPLPEDSAPLPEDLAPLPEVPAPLPEDLAASRPVNEQLAMEDAGRKPLTKADEATSNERCLVVPTTACSSLISGYRPESFIPHCKLLIEIVYSGYGTEVYLLERRRLVCRPP